jgi:uncharacterized lipoprotein YbaY
MRTVKGKVILPVNSPTTKARRATIEVRDVSQADAPSQVIAEQQIEDVDLRPGSEIDFSLEVPDVEPNRQLSMRVHIDINGSGKTESGDLLTTQNYAVQANGSPPAMQVPVQVI